MKIGFCKDEEQKCESKRCYFCSQWGLHQRVFGKERNDSQGNT